ncbi:hypothetical protein BDV95DRAFT_149162 [Massariosphaeria phaeospora]|uniref:Uncharacterized protein n=1 Tax=Massariosphaeria phaeospora TaxID=100035 RepID=A0A7C8MH82_9PLEO|nr:hypothetical protein BDV95DRAFT_149162 [Massariosphaeria phaeospora]
MRPPDASRLALAGTTASGHIQPRSLPFCHHWRKAKRRGGPGHLAARRRSVGGAQQTAVREREPSPPLHCCSAQRPDGYTACVIGTVVLVTADLGSKCSSGVCLRDRVSSEGAGKVGRQEADGTPACPATKKSRYHHVHIMYARGEARLTDRPRYIGIREAPWRSGERLLRR